jgi:hypothetical protein
MYELKKIGKVFTSKFVGTGPSSYEKRIYRALVSQRLRNTGLEQLCWSGGGGGGGGGVSHLIVLLVDFRQSGCLQIVDHCMESC